MDQHDSRRASLDEDWTALLDILERMTPGKNELAS
jgi:hypothetical protein